MKNLLIFTIIFISTFAQAQTSVRRTCATHELKQAALLQNPTLQTTFDEVEQQTNDFIARPQLQTRSAMTTIPVVVHIVYRSANDIENITDEQVMSQLTVLNKDFQRLNSDKNFTPSVFQPTAADCGYEFKLAVRDPLGKTTKGIMRYASSRMTPWGKNDDVKKPANGGIAPWDATKYLNIYVCAIGSGILGYSTTPGMAANIDGVVIDFRYFGTIGTVSAPYNLGRTTTHEIGHWLNLRHVWGDAECGDDLVSDTPSQMQANYGNPTFPHLTCGTDARGDMFMNFMDYSDDAVMNMFSAGQKSRMSALFATGGLRASLLASNALTPVVETCLAPTLLHMTQIAAKSATLSWTNAAENANYNVEYRLKNTITAWTSVGVANVNNLNLSNLLASTTYEIRLKSACSTATQNIYSATLSFTTPAETQSVKGSTTATNDISESAKVKISPNPAAQFFNIDFESETNGTALVQLFDLQGKEISRTNHEVLKEKNTINVSTQSLQNGMYLMVLTNGTKIFSKKISVQSH